MNMSELKITESSSKSKNIMYIYDNLSPIIKQLGCISDLRGGKNRYELLIDVPSSYKELLLSEVEDKISNVFFIESKYSENCLDKSFTSRLSIAY